MKVLNLTQHKLTPEQVDEVKDKYGRVFRTPRSTQESILELLTFSSLPSKEEIDERAKKLAHLCLCSLCEGAVIGGATFLMGPLERELKARKIKPLYAFSLRESIEEVSEDGTVLKKSIFKHLGFIEA